MESARLWREVASHANSAPGWRTVGANGVPTNLEQSSESFASVDSMKQQQFGRAKACKTCGWTSLIGTLRNAWRQWTQKGRVNVAFKCFQCFLKLRNHPKHSSNMGMPLYTLNILEPSWTHFQVVDISRTNNCFKPKPEASYNRIQQDTTGNLLESPNDKARDCFWVCQQLEDNRAEASYGFLWLFMADRGLEHEFYCPLFSMSYMACHPKPIDELHHFSRWFFNHQADGIFQVSLVRWVQLRVPLISAVGPWSRKAGKLCQKTFHQYISWRSESVDFKTTMLNRWCFMKLLMIQHDFLWTWDYEEPINSTSIWLTSYIFLLQLSLLAGVLPRL